MTTSKRDLVFIGGGHTHALVIKQLGMKPIDGVRLTLISEQTLTPYSGMLPGFVAGHYSYLETHIDLNRLCQWANVRYIRGRVNGIDADKRSVFVEAQAVDSEAVRSQSVIEYDHLSIDIGSTPDLSVPGARDYAVGVKPVSHFGSIWNSLLQASGGSGRWGVVGAGAGGVELVLAMVHRLGAHSHLEFHLAFSSSHVLPGYPDKVVKAAEAALADCNVTLHPNFRVAEVTKDGLISENGEHVALEKSIWCTGAAAADWLSETGLETSDRGFISVNPYLQSKSHNNVFAVGDCADMLFDPRPKAGVYAVRQAPYLVNNLRLVCSVDDKPLKPVNLQTDFLSLLSLGEKKAVGCRSGFTASGRWVWKLKDHIDRTFMQKLNDPGDKKAMAAMSSADDEVMHCAGCGSKLGPDIIAGNLNNLSPYHNPSITPALGKAEDASLWQVTSGKLAVQSIDGFRSFSHDLGRFGEICVNHALSDLYAMGAVPVSAQVWINLAHAHPRIQKRDHRLLMTSITNAFNKQQVALAGGHSSEGLETHVAIVANGEVSKHDVLKKNSVNDGDVLVLTKPLGTGLILAADMLAKAPAQAIEAAFDSMLESNRDVAIMLPDLSVSAVTDVTGFGLIGHLLEMLDNTDLIADLTLADVPHLDGALELSQSGYRSTLYPHLEPYLHQCEVAADTGVAGQHAIELLLDPQTSGGLLIALPEERVSQLLSRCPSASVIGRLSAKRADSTGMELKRIRIC